MIVFISLLIILIVSFIFLPVRINTQLCISKHKQSIFLSVSILKIKVYERVWQLNETMNTSLNDEFLTELLSSSNEKKIRYAVNGIIQYFRMINEIGKPIVKTLKVYKLEWITHFGTGDASSTGIISGSLWAIKGVAKQYTYLFENLLCEPKINLIPCYQSKIFKTNVTCIFSIKIMKVIVILIKLTVNTKTKPQPTS